MIVPILLYGSEVWGRENVDIINQFQLKFCKMLLGLKQSIPNIMVYGELGITSVSQRDNLHEMSNPVFWEKKKKNIVNLSSAKNAQSGKG